MPKNIVALQTARTGSESIPKKNLLKVHGMPLFMYSIVAARDSRHIQHVYCSTDDDEIMAMSRCEQFKIVERPPHLRGSDASHLETIRHGVLEIEKELGKQDIVVLLLGNVVGLDGETLDDAIDMLGENDSVVSVSEFNMFNPFRVHTIEDGLLKTWANQEDIRSDMNINDKNSAGSMYYCNGNFWVMQRDIIFQEDNQLPFQWLGHNIVPYVQRPFLELDAEWQIPLLSHGAMTSPRRIR